MLVEGRVVNGSNAVCMQQFVLDHAADVNMPSSCAVHECGMEKIGTYATTFSTLENHMLSVLNGSRAKMTALCVRASYCHMCIPTSPGRPSLTSKCTAQDRLHITDVMNQGASEAKPPHALSTMAMPAHVGGPCISPMPHGTACCTASKVASSARWPASPHVWLVS